MFKKVFITAESERLILRHLHESDFDALFSYRNDPEVAKYQGWTDKTEHEIQLLIQEQNTLQPGIPGIWFMFAIQLKTTAVMIGDCAINVNKVDPRQAELGITLSRQYQGNGYAREAISCVLHYVFKNSAIERVVLITDADNTHCIKLIKNLGLNLINSAHGFKGAPIDKDLYDLKENELMYSAEKKDFSSTH